MGTPENKAAVDALRNEPEMRQDTREWLAKVASLLPGEHAEHIRHLVDVAVDLRRRANASPSPIRENLNISVRANIDDIVTEEIAGGINEMKKGTPAQQEVATLLFSQIKDRSSDPEALKHFLQRTGAESLDAMLEKSLYDALPPPPTPVQTAQASAKPGRK